MKVKNWSEYILAYALLAVTLGLGAWFVITSQNTFEVFLGGFYIKEENQFLLARQARFFDIIFPLVLWISWFIMLIVVEEYYRKGVEKHSLIKRFMKVTGVLLILLFVSDLFLTLMLGLTATGWLRVLLMIIELLAGIAFLILSRSKRATQTEPVSTGQ